jgi:hypothetical protein
VQSYRSPCIEMWVVGLFFAAERTFSRRRFDAGIMGREPSLD